MTGTRLQRRILWGAVATQDKETIAALCKDAAATERNFILKKGESTVGLRREQLELRQEAALMQMFERLVQRRDDVKKDAS